jgi:purine-binding chemotaxis protein CheW
MDQISTAPADNTTLSDYAGNRSGTKSGILEFVTFAIDDDHYGVDIMSVREIKGWSGVSPLAGQPDYVRGVLNLRGAVIPIIDLRCRLGQGMTEATATHIVLIVAIGKRLVGLLADQVLDIVAYEAQKIQPVPRVSSETAADLLAGLIATEEGMITLIDLPTLFGDDVESAAA